jgi:hypothetical protein
MEVAKYQQLRLFWHRRGVADAMILVLRSTTYSATYTVLRSTYDSAT